MDILQRITDIRKMKNMSIYELADKCNISKNTIYRWYSKNYTPTLDTLQIICEKGFDMQLVEFFAVDCDLIPATNETRELFEVWSTLNKNQKQAIMQIINSYRE